MASLNSLVRSSMDILNADSSWVVFWKTGRSWNGKQVTIGDNLDMPSCELDFLHKIYAVDENAIIFNLDYSIDKEDKENMGDFSFAWLCETIKNCYALGNSSLLGFLEFFCNRQKAQSEMVSRVAAEKQAQANPETPTSHTVSGKEQRREEICVINQRIEDIIDQSSTDCLFRRGSVWLMELSKTSGSVQYGKRPVVIIQNNILNVHSPTVLIAPLTSKDRKFSKAHVSVNAVWLKLPSLVLLEQITVVDKLRLKRCIGTFDDDAMERIDRAVNWCLST